MNGQAGAREGDLGRGRGGELEAGGQAGTPSQEDGRGGDEVLAMEVRHQIQK